MMNNKNLLASAIALAVAAPHAIAQDNSTSDNIKVERIEVTGSRILREGAIAPSPVTVISGEELLNTGAMNIGEVLNELPSLAPTYSLANSGRFIGTAGLNLLDLRGMGTSRTLVLVDGKRHVSSSAGSASVDVNNIPSSWIQSVEVITGGASAVYGADAVTGVVNFRLKKNIEGLDVSVTKGYADDNPYENYKLSLSAGTNFDNGRGNIAFSAEVSGQDAFNSLDRDSTKTPYFSVANPDDGDFDADGNFLGHDGVPDEIWVRNAGYYDDSPSGNFYFYNENSESYDWYIFNDDGSTRPQNLGNVYSWGVCSDCELLDLNAYTDLQPAFDRFNVNLKANYDITENLNLYGEAKYVKSEGSSRGQPAYFEYGRALTISRDNAYIHPTLATLMDTNGLDSIDMHRFMDDAGRRFEENTRETQRFVVGLEGEIFEDWSLDTYAIYGKTELEQKNHFNLIYDRFYQSIDAVKNDQGEIVCRDESNGCIPTSLFGAGAVNPEAAEWFTTTSISESKIQQTVLGGSFSNSALMDLPAGPVGVSVGVEYRKEESDSYPDEFAATGATFLNSILEEHGSFNVKEIFTEVSVPLLADVFLVQDLALDAAVRYADYSTTGSATSWKTGFSWTINDELRVRGTYAEALRAPNIGELFGPQNETFMSVEDPCSAQRVQSDTRRQNCADLGVPSSFESQTDSSTTPGISGGNPDLKPEESESFTVGFVYQPEFFSGFSVTVDYWAIEITDAIVSITGQNIVDQCVDAEGGINNLYCGLITRDATSSELTHIVSIAQNVASQEAEGIDFEFGYDFDALAGSFTTKLIGTYLDSRRSYDFQDRPEQFEENAGTLGESTWQANASIAYTHDAWSASWKTRYLSAADVYNPQELEDNPDARSIMEWGSYFVTDIRGGYKFDSGFSIEVGIDNLFDRDLPVPYTSGTGESSAAYDNIGRFFYATVSYKM